MGRRAIVISSDAIGRGDEELGRLLMANFLRLLGEAGDKPETIFLVNGGVNLAAEGSKVLEHLKRLQQAGVRILLCRTCVEWFNLEGQIRVGEIGAMGTLVKLATEQETTVI